MWRYMGGPRHALRMGARLARILGPELGPIVLPVLDRGDLIDRIRAAVEHLRAVAAAAKDRAAKQALDGLPRDADLSEVAAVLSTLTAVPPSQVMAQVSGAMASEAVQEWICEWAALCERPDPCDADRWIAVDVDDPSIPAGVMLREAMATARTQAVFQ